MRKWKKRALPIDKLPTLKESKGNKDVFDCDEYLKETDDYSTSSMANEVNRHLKKQILKREEEEVESNKEAKSKR